MLKTLNFLVLITVGFLFLTKVGLLIVDRDNFVDRAIDIAEFFVLINAGFYLANMTKER